MSDEAHRDPFFAKLIDDVDHLEHIPTEAAQLSYEQDISVAKLILDHPVQSTGLGEVTNEAIDKNLLGTMGPRAKAVLAVEELDVVADMGYYDGQEIKACLDAGVTPYIPKPNTSRNRKRGLFTKADFRYDGLTRFKAGIVALRVIEALQFM